MTPTPDPFDRSPDESFDVIVIGGRVAGASLAIRLARAGQRVAVVDKATFPSDTLSTHIMFPDGISELAELGALARLHERHDLVLARYSWRVLGHEVGGAFTPVDGFDRCLSVRRISLDAVLVELAEESGATLVLGSRVTGLVGAGTPDDPVRGVHLDDGRVLRAPWVLAADGYRSKVASRLGVPRTRERHGDVALLIGYWRGLPASDWCRIDLHESSGLVVAPCEDGLHLLAVAGPRDLTRGTPAEREARYREGLLRFPSVLNPRLLHDAELISPVRPAPETSMRGYFRQAAGAGWALVGDAGHFKHPTTGQGIGDALAQSRFVAEDLIAGGDLSGFEAWREHRSLERFELSFRAARFPSEETAVRYAGLAADPVASQEFLDTFTMRVRPSEVFTAERSHRWRAAAAFEDGLRQVVALVDDLDPDQLTTTVPACPLWTARDLLAHLAGVAEDAVQGRFYEGSARAWTDPGLAAEREAWTAGQVQARRDASPDDVLAELQRHGHALVRALRRGEPAACEVPAWMITAPVADIAAHLEDLRETFGIATDPSTLVARSGFGIYRAWLASRLQAAALPALLLTDGQDEWTIGGDDRPRLRLEADRHELFRGISGRRTPDRISTWVRDGDITPYLSVISPYPLAG